MKDRIKRIISLCLVTIMVLGVLTGCSKKHPTADAPADLTEVKDFTYWFQDSSRKAISKNTTPDTYYFRLTQDLTIPGAAIINNGHTVFFDLNGFTLTTQADTLARAFEVTGGASLILKNGTVSTVGANDNGGMIFLDGAGCKLELMDVTLTSADDSFVDPSFGGGVIYATSPADGAPAVISMYSGTTINGSTAGRRGAGGSVMLAGNAEMYLYDGVVQNGIAGNSGNIHLADQSKLYMHGGTVTGGQTVQMSGVSGDGGNINVTAQALFCQYGGTISGGKCARAGGNLYVGNFGKSDKQGYYLYGGTIEGGYAPVNGGNLYALDKMSNVVLYGGEIKAGKAVNGGNLYLEACNFELRGGLLTGTSEVGVHQNGNNIYGVRATMNLYSGEITGGWVTGNGGNVFAADCAVNMYGGTIKDGKLSATSVGYGGGNIWVGGSSVFNLYGGEIKDGQANLKNEEATASGPNVCVAGKALMQMFGGTVKDGFIKGTTCRTGCIYVYGQVAGNDAVFHMYGGRLENGELDAEVMRGLCVGVYSVLADESGIATGRIFDGEIVFKGPDDSPDKRHTLFGNKSGNALNLFVFDSNKYKGLTRGAVVGACKDKTHNTEVETVDATCTTQSCVKYHCDTCGDWYKITGEATGHTETAETVAPTATTAGYTEHTCSVCGDHRYTDIIPATGK